MDTESIAYTYLPSSITDSESEVSDDIFEHFVRSMPDLLSEEMGFLGKLDDTNRITREEIPVDYSIGKLNNRSTSIGKARKLLPVANRSQGKYRASMNESTIKWAASNTGVTRYPRIAASEPSEPGSDLRFPADWKPKLENCGFFALTSMMIEGQNKSGWHPGKPEYQALYLHPLEVKGFNQFIIAMELKRPSMKLRDDPAVLIHMFANDISLLIKCVKHVAAMGGNNGNPQEPAVQDQCIEIEWPMSYYVGRMRSSIREMAEGEEFFTFLQDNAAQESFGLLARAVMSILSMTL